MNTKQDFVALDIAILCNVASLREAILYNQKIFEAWPEGFCFDETHKPHITLLQMYCPREKLEEFHAISEDAILKIVQELRNNPYWAISGYSTEISFNSDICVPTLELKPHRQVADFHKELLKLASNFHSPLGDEHAFFRGVANSQSQDWVRNYISSKREKGYTPHLTLGFGPKKDLKDLYQQIPIPQSLGLDEIVSAQLGNFCSVSSNIYKSWKI